MKLLATLLVAAFLTASLTACGQGGDAKKAPEAKKQDAPKAEEKKK